MNDSILGMRITGICDAQKATRRAFIVLLVVSLASMLAAYNAYFAWDRSFAFDPLPVDAKMPTQIIVQTQLQEWVKSQTIDLALLGIRVLVSDLALLSSVALLVISIWFYFCLRRENQTIGSLLLETQNEPRDRRRAIYEIICSYLVFTRPDDELEPIRSLRERLAGQTPTLLRYLVRVLFWLPLIAVVFLIFCDLNSLIWFSAFREQQKPLGEQINKVQFWTNIALMDGIALGVAVMILNITVNTAHLESSTVSVLKEYANKP